MSGSTPPWSRIRLAPASNGGAGQHDEWTFPPRPHFLRSSAFDIMSREVRRYLDGEIAGRSFLVAGHRGAGKTSAVTRMISDQYRGAIQEALSQAEAFRDLASDPSKAPPKALRRPLLVPLHGPSLLPPPARRESESASPAEPNTQGGSDDSPAEPGAGDTAKDAGEDPIGHLLEQVTISLYRAFAREASFALSNHARYIAAQDRRAGRRHQRDLPELAAQVTLDLDQAPDITALRAAWGRMDRLEAGVLWPDRVGRMLNRQGRQDQGLREIMALVTANQAFRECIGKIEETQGAKTEAAIKATLALDAKADAKDQMNRLLALGLGGLVTASAWSSGPTAAAAVGVATALFGTFALTWKSERRREQTRSRDYRFIPNHSVMTLERDLPLVVERIQETGLAPIFVIDELDKLDNVRGEIAAIIDRLKSLTTDRGVFFFLTGREYFDEIEREIEREEFPREHTYFSHRLLVSYRPEDLSAYVRDLWLPADLSTQPDVIVWTLVFYITHQARLNMVDVARALAGLCDHDGACRLTDDQINGSGRFRVPVVIQLGIEHVLRKKPLIDRGRADTMFTHWAVDALYMISRAWRQGETVTINRDALIAELIRRGRVQGKDDAERKAHLLRLLPNAQVEMLRNHVLGLADLLTDFKRLYRALADELADQDRMANDSMKQRAGTRLMTPRERASLAALLPLVESPPVNSPGLLRKTGDAAYEFLIDDDGLDRAPMSWDDVRGLVARVDGLLRFLDDRQVPLAELVAADVVPGGVVAVHVTAALAALREGQAPIHEQTPTHAAALAAFERIAQEHRLAIITFVALATRLVRDAEDIGASVSPRAAAAAMRRLLPISAIVAVLRRAPAPAESQADAADQPAAAPVPSATAAQQAEFAAYSSLFPLSEADPPRNGLEWRALYDASINTILLGHLAAASWNPETDPKLLRSWSDRLDRWALSTERSRSGLGLLDLDSSIRYFELLASAMGVGPYPFFRHDLSRMTLLDWSRCAQAAFDPDGQPERMDLMARILGVLGFHDILRAPLGQPENGLRSNLVTVERPAILLLHHGNGRRSTQPLGGVWRGQPVLSLSLSDAEQYASFFAWLYERQAIGTEEIDLE